MPRDVIARLLYDTAEAQDGYFSTRQAEEAGVSRVTLAKAAHRGSLERASRGVYRFTRFPVLSANAQLWEGVLWPHVRTRQNGTLSHYTALLLHGLSDVNPAKVHITLPRAFRQTRRPPPWLVVHNADLDDEDVVFVDNLPVTSVPRTLYDIAKLGDHVAFADAVRDAQQRDIKLPKELLTDE